MNKDGILRTGTKNIFEVRNISNDLLEKSLHMRALAYLSSVKADLLRDTIFKIDSSKKDACRARDHLEEKVQERTRELETSVKKLKATEEELREANDKLSRRVEDSTAEVSKLSYAVEQSPCSVVVTDTNGNIEYANSKFAQLTGYTSEESIGQNTRILKSGKTTDEEYKQLWTVIKSGGEWRGGFCNRKKDGTLFWESTSISPVKNDKGVITNFISIKEDVTEHKKTENKLLLHSKILENMNEGVNLVRANNGTIVYTNTQFNNLFGYEGGEIVGKHISILHSPVEVAPEEKTKEIIQELNDKGCWSGEICNTKKDRTAFWCRVNISTFNHPEYGEVWVSVHEDITKRKNTEAKLASQEKLYRTLVETIPHVIWVANRAGKKIFINRAWKELTGRNVADSLGDKWAASLHPDDAEELLEKWRRAYKSGGQYRGECRFKTKEGPYKTTTFIGMPVRNTSGEITNWVGINMDITERKLMEEQIKASLKEKEALLNEVHHRVKNNLQIISSLLDMSSMKTENQETITLFEESRNRVDSIANIHSQLYESERFDEVDMGKHIHGLAGNLLKIYSKEKTVTIDIKSTNVYLPVPQAVPCALVLNELISNSLKHAFRDEQQGIISISMQQLSDNIILVKIKDNGIGIPQEIDIDRTKSLGLKLTRNIVHKQLNGKIEVINNKGTTFIIKFKSTKEVQ